MYNTNTRVYVRPRLQVVCGVDRGNLAAGKARRCDVVSRRVHYGREGIVA